MANEYWLCVQIPALPRRVQTEKDQWQRNRDFFRVPSNFSRFDGTNRVRDRIRSIDME